MDDYQNNKRQSWKRGESRQHERKFVAPQVRDDDGFYEFESVEVARPKKKDENAMKVLSALFGFMILVGLYTPAFYFAVRAVGVDSFEYRDAVVVSLCFTILRFLDATFSQQMRDR